MDFWYQGNMGKHYNLSLSETAVYSALCCLCAKGPRNYNCTQISELLDPISADTVSRACKKLLAKGLISIVDNQIRITVRTNASSTPQNAESAPQNAESTPQNAEFLKESTKEKEYKENYKVSIKDQPTDFLISPFIPPSEEECCAYAQQNNIPKVVAQKWYCYQEQHSWTQANGQPIGKWQPSLRGFWLRERQDNLIGARATTKDIRSLTYLEEQQELARQNKERERSQRQREDAEYEANRSAHQAAAEAFFAKHCKGLK